MNSIELGLAVFALSAVLSCTACTLPDVSLRAKVDTAEKVPDAGSERLADSNVKDSSASEPTTPSAGMGGASGAAGAAGAAGGGGTPDAGPVAGSSGSGGSAPAQLDDDGGLSDASAVVLRSFEQLRAAQKLGINATCSCFKEFDYRNRMACEANYGLFQPGQAECVAGILEHEALQAIPALQCRRAVFESWQECLAFELDCSDGPDLDAVKECVTYVERGQALCPRYPDALRAKLDVCYDLAEAYWAYVDVVYRQTERVCRCYDALGYDSHPACQQGEGIVYSEFTSLETCFFEIEGEAGPNPGERATAAAYFTCDRTRTTEYAICMDAVEMCEAGAAMRCKNLYRIDRAACRNDAHFLRDPFELCGQ